MKKIDAALVADFTRRPAPVPPAVARTVVFDPTWYARHQIMQDYTNGKITEAQASHELATR